MEGPTRGVKRKIFGAILVMLGGLDYLLAAKGNFAMPVFTIALFCCGLILFIWGVAAQQKRGAGKESPGELKSS